MESFSVNCLLKEFFFSKKLSRLLVAGMGFNKLRKWILNASCVLFAHSLSLSVFLLCFPMLLNIYLSYIFTWVVQDQWALAFSLWLMRVDFDTLPEVIQHALYPRLLAASPSTSLPNSSSTFGLRFRCHYATHTEVGLTATHFSL